MADIFWTASNANSYLCGFRRAKSMLAAVRAARHFVINELRGDGEIVYCDTDPRNEETYPESVVRIEIRARHHAKWQITKRL
jgi:hypothetical protein